MIRKMFVKKNVVTIKNNQIFINSILLDSIIRKGKFSSSKISIVINKRVTIRLDSYELNVYQNNKCLEKYVFETSNKKQKYLHLFIRILSNYSLMIDGAVDNNYFYKEKKAYEIEGIKFQPIILYPKYELNLKLKGMGLFDRGLHFSGIITPSNYTLCCICDECKKSFMIKSYHAGIGKYQYFYSEDGKETLLVPYGEIEDMPTQLCKNISDEIIEKVDTELKINGYEKFKFYNPFRCPFCGAAYIDFKKYPTIREYEYYSNVLLGKTFVKFERKTT